MYDWFSRVAASVDHGGTIRVIVSHRFSTVRAADFDRLGVDEVVNRVRERAGDAPVYLSVDIDVLDGAYAWGTCGPEIGGLTGRELVRGLQIVAAGPIAAADCVEVAPMIDPSGNTARVGARIVVDILALRACRVRDGAAGNA